MWGGWPLVVRPFGTTPALSAIQALMAVLPAAVVVGLKGSDSTTGGPRAIAAFGVAGILMGIGLILFNLLATNRTVEISRIAPIINTGMLLTTVLGGIFFYGEMITAQKVAGILLLCVGIFLLR